MKTNIETYMTWITENLEYVEEVHQQLIVWERLYKHKVFDGSWPKTIAETMKALKSDIKIELDQCREFIKTIKNLKEVATAYNNQPKGIKND